MRWAAGVLLLAAVGWGILQLPMDVPDTSSPMTTNHVGNVDSGGNVGQTFVPKRAYLDRITLAIATEQRTNKAAIVLTVRDGGPNGPALRTVQEVVSNLPEGDTFSFSQEHPGIMDPQWHSFRFQPITDSAGRKLYFSVEGADVPAENRVRVAMKFYNGYPEGRAFVNGGEQNAHLVFRAESRGRVQDYLGIVAANLTASKQGALANPVTYLALGMAYVFLIAGLFWFTWHVLRTCVTSEHDDHGSTTKGS